MRADVCGLRGNGGDAGGRTQQSEGAASPIDQPQRQWRWAGALRKSPEWKGGQGIVTRTKAPPEPDPAAIWPLEGGWERGQELRGLPEALPGGGNPASQSQNRNEDLRTLVSPAPPDAEPELAVGSVGCGAPGQRHENRGARGMPWRQEGGGRSPVPANTTQGREETTKPTVTPASHIQEFSPNLKVCRNRPLLR